MNKTGREIIEESQEKTLPILQKYIAKKSLLDVGCGNALNAYFFNKKMGTEVTLVDVEDIRDKDAKRFPFVESSIEKIRFENDTFDVVFLQFVIHHLPQHINLEQVLQNLGNIGKKVIIVEEIIDEKTNVKKAREFDEKMNRIIHPTSKHMEIHKYYTDSELKHLFALSNLQIIEEKMLSHGCNDDGFLRCKFYVLEQQATLYNATKKTKTEEIIRA